MIYRLNGVQRFGSALSGALLLILSFIAAIHGGVVGKNGMQFPPVASAVMICMGIAIGLCAIWISIFQPANREDHWNDTWTSDDEYSQDRIECQFMLRSRSAAVVFDQGNHLVHFHYCHVPFGFLTSSAEHFSCTPEDIMQLHDRIVYKAGTCLTIITRTGKCVIRKTDVDYTDIYLALKMVVPENNPGFKMHDPRMQFPIGLGIAACTMAGLLAGCWLLPVKASDTALFLFGALGATLGISFSLITVWWIDRSLQIRSIKTIEADRSRPATPERTSTL